VKVLETSGDFLKIGVCSENTPPHNSLGFSDFGWSFSGDFKWHNTAIPYDLSRNYLTVSVDSDTVNLRRFTRGDVIGVLLDMDQGTVGFFLNEKFCGVAFRQLPSELYAGVSLDAVGECVELDFHKQAPPLAQRTALSSM